jgi:hypothetical protein
MDWNTFKEFLRSLGVEMEGHERHAPPLVHAEPVITMLQRSRDHEALYRVDLIEARPQLLVLLPSNQAPLRFHFYLVELSESHPLGDVLERLISYQQGSEGFEQNRGFAEWQLLYAIVETMKVLFWAGLETSQFPHEITVQKIL